MKPLRCQKCGYIWNYNGKLNRATCPNCKSTVINRKRRNYGR